MRSSSACLARRGVFPRACGTSLAYGWGDSMAMRSSPALAILAPVPAGLTPRGWRAGAGARRTMIPSGSGGGLVMRAVDPRLLRHARAARGYLALVVVL